MRNLNEQVIYSYTNNQYSRTRLSQLHYHVRPKDAPPEEVAYSTKARARRMGFKTYHGKMFFLLECKAQCDVIW